MRGMSGNYAGNVHPLIQTTSSALHHTSVCFAYPTRRFGISWICVLSLFKKIDLAILLPGQPVQNPAAPSKIDLARIWVFLAEQS